MSMDPRGERLSQHPDLAMRRPVGMPDNAAVSIDDGPVFRCFDGGQRWNGAVCPRFSRWSANRVIAWITEQQAKNPALEDMHFAWDGETILLTEGAYADEPGYTPLRIEPDDTGRYLLGAGWIWTLSDATVHLVLLRDLRAENAATRRDEPVRPIVVRAAIDAYCPRCGGPRGLPRRVYGEDQGRPYAVDTWTNPCAHHDTLPEVLAEAGLR